MNTEGKNSYKKRSQKDYSYSFKLAVVKEVEQGKLTSYGAKVKYGIQGNATVLTWLRKYGNFDWDNQSPINMPKSPEQKLLAREAKTLIGKTS